LNILVHTMHPCISGMTGDRIQQVLCRTTLEQKDVSPGGTGPANVLLRLPALGFSAAFPD
jgi:hypothetical protein